MPQRFLRPGLRTSDSWNAVSFGAQSLYVRILTLVDDFGRYDARIAILHGECFALRPDIKTQQTATFRNELAEHGLIQLYVVEEKEYLQVTRWQERIRNKSRYPTPPAVIRQPMAADGSQKTLPSPSPSPSPYSSNGGALAPAAPTALDIAEEIYQSYPKKAGKDNALRAIRKRFKEGNDPKFLLERVKIYSAAIGWLERKFIPHPATWFNDGRFNDDPAEWNDPDKVKRLDSNQQRRNSEYDRFMAERAQKKT